MKHFLSLITLTLLISLSSFAKGFSSIEDLLKDEFNTEFADYMRQANFTNDDKEIALEIYTLRGKPEKLIPLAKQLSNKGYSLGDYWLGWCYEGGDGVGMDFQQAFKYFLKAAKNPVPFPYALERVGSYYYSGEGVERNLSEAYNWFDKGKKTIKHKDYQAICIYRQAYICLNKENPTPSDLESAFNLFTQVSELANKNVGSDFGHPAYGNLVPYMHKHSAYLAAMLILTENVHDGNEVEGIKWLEKASELGDDEAQFNLGVYLIHAKNDKVKGLDWINKAAIQGNSDALIYLQQNK